ncbi:MAG: alpha/beta hydrolase [Ferruginibacter sp.]
MQKRLFFILLPALFFGTDCSGQVKQVKSGVIKAGNLQVYYERAGEGDAILLLHAGLQDHAMWKEQVKALSAQYDVITPDLPFHGKTTGTDTSLLAQEVIKILLDSLHLQKVAVAGLSMGAAVTLDFIIAYPQRVSKAFLISAGINGYDKIHSIDSVSMEWYRQFTRALQEKDTVRAAVEFTKAWAEGVYRLGDSLKAPVSQYVYNKTLNNLRLHKMEGWPLLQNYPPAIERLTSVRIPVLVINGDKDLPYIKATSGYLEKNIPGARRVVMKGVAHMLNMEKPAELNKLMMDFLAAPAAH